MWKRPGIYDFTGHLIRRILSYLLFLFVLKSGGSGEASKLSVYPNFTDNAQPISSKILQEQVTWKQSVEFCMEGKFLIVLRSL